MLDIVDDICTIIIHRHSCFLRVLSTGHLLKQCACQLLVSLNLTSGKKGKL